MCISSILRFDSDVHFFILHQDLSKEDMDELQSSFDCLFTFIYVDESRFAKFPTSSRYPLEIYYRLFASSLLPSDLDRILYLDVDIVVIRSLKSLYTMDFEDHAYIACTHVEETMTKINAKRLNMETVVPYVNTGVLLMNLDMLRDLHSEEKVLEFVNKNKNRMMLFDQDILTGLYGHITKIVDYRLYNLSDRMLAVYNLRHRDNIDLNWVSEHSVIIHYCGRNKPWKSGYKGVLGKFYEELEL